MPSFVAQAASMESSKSRRWSVGAIHAANEPNVGDGCCYGDQIRRRVLTRGVFANAFVRSALGRDSRLAVDSRRAAIKGKVD